jgi:hypothetical protein
MSITKADVENRIKDWETRLTELFNTIETWTQGIQDIQIEHGTVVQRAEMLMRDHNISPRLLPTMWIIIGLHRISFVPSALWVVGANGRVNINTNTRQYALVDMGNREWRIADLPEKSNLRTFTREIFQDIIRDNT